VIREPSAQAGVAFDPFEDGFVRSPFEQYARLRTHAPVHRSALLEGWVITRYQDVSRVLREPAISVELDHATPTPVVQAEIERRDQEGRASGTLVLRDDPDHARLRRLLQQPFGPRAIEGLREMITRRVDEFLEPQLPLGRMDVITDFAYPLPVAVFCEMLGIPAEDSPEFRSWTAAVARSLDPMISLAERDACLALMDQMSLYLTDQIELKRAHPGDDIMTALVQATDEGDRLTTEELLAQLVTLYVAGHEPTTSLIGNGLLHLLDEPDQLDALRHDPSRLPHALNELLRFDGPNQFVRRITLEPIELSGQEVPAGAVLYLCVASANRDADHFGADADRLRIDRPDAVQHLQFGAGIHNCLGNHLARMQAEVALGALLTRLDHIELAGPAEWSERMVLRGLQSLPITFSAHDPTSEHSPRDANSEDDHGAG
jgi:cytochrome P450